MTNKQKIDYGSAEHAHWRIDEQQKEMKAFKEWMVESSKLQEKSARREIVQVTVVTCGVLFYIGDAVGIINLFVKGI